MPDRRCVPPGRGSTAGVVSLEWVLALPVLVLAVAGLLAVAGVMRDALLAQDAARAGARAAATSTGERDVAAAVDRALPGRAPEVTVRPRRRSAGDVVEVTVALTRRLGRATHRLEGRAVARVEPQVGSPAPP